MKTLLAFASLAALLTGPALATDYALTIVNKTSVGLTKIVVKKGTVTGFKPLAAFQKGTVTVTLPDGQCEAPVGFAFDDGQGLEPSAFDFCQSDTLPVEEE